MENTQSRWKSYILWTSLGSVLVLFLQATGALEKMGLTSDTLNAFISSILMALIALGVINNPSDADKV